MDLRGGGLRRLRNLVAAGADHAVQRLAQAAGIACGALFFHPGGRLRPSGRPPYEALRREPSISRAQFVRIRSSDGLALRRRAHMGHGCRHAPKEDGRHRHSTTSVTSVIFRCSSPALPHLPRSYYTSPFVPETYMKKLLFAILL